MTRIPGSTYRLQFHAGFKFQDAVAILDYLQGLGITDIYASPYFQAGTESTHGYDVADPNTISPQIGGAEGHRKFIEALKSRGIGHLLDFVPNHMGISETLNSWWMNVLEFGMTSPYAEFFDIDWHPRKEVLQEKIMLPILGDRYGKVLEAGELRLQRRGGSLFVVYFETRLPLSPASYPAILGRAVPLLEKEIQPRLESVIGRFREGAASEAKLALKELSERIGDDIDRALESFHGTPGSPETFNSLHELLEGQAYRLGYWRLASEEINYRRFFDINTLAGIRVELPEVFEASHQFVFELLGRGDVTGLRIDHVDGLWDPAGYLMRLQERFAEITGKPDERLYLLVEKILEMRGEYLPPDWPVHGTTGYEFANQVTHVLVDKRSEKHLTKTWQSFAGNFPEFERLAYEKKHLIMEASFQSEILALGRKLDELSESHRNYRDFTRNILTNAVREVIACFPVYRTYATPSLPPDEAGERAVMRAVSLARRRNPTVEKPVFDFLRDVLLMRLPDYLTSELRDAHIRFVMHFQQVTGPIMAKGVEDTSLYIYNRLLALNEVGGDPGKFGMTVEEFHKCNEERCKRTPHGLLATSTHDTKRSEDVRLRIAAISELPVQWRSGVNRWKKMNRSFRRKLDGEWAPSKNEEYFIYQTLAGIWPVEEESPDWANLSQRVQAYLVKALREAKVNSSWTDSNSDWEEAVTSFAASLLESDAGRSFREEFGLFAQQIARIGGWNSVSEKILKCTLPGVPDVYQGTEIWDFSLVDPDNRRPVDYELRTNMLRDVQGKSPAMVMEDRPTGLVKLCLLEKLLNFRKSNPQLFSEADYFPLKVDGRLAEHMIAFQRRAGSSRLLVLVPRLTGRLGENLLQETWDGTYLHGDIFEGDWSDIMNNKNFSLKGEPAPISEFLHDFPAGVFFQEKTTGKI